LRHFAKLAETQITTKMCVYISGADWVKTSSKIKEFYEILKLLAGNKFQTMSHI